MGKAYSHKNARQKKATCTLTSPQIWDQLEAGLVSLLPTLHTNSGRTPCVTRGRKEEGKERSRVREKVEERTRKGKVVGCLLNKSL